MEVGSWGLPDPHVDVRLSAYDYDLPKELIAQEPIEPRDAARLLKLNRATGAIEHHCVRDLPELLAPGDLIVANRSRVLRSRLVGTKVESGGRVEMTLLRPFPDGRWEALIRGHRVRSGQRVAIAPGVVAQIGEPASGARLVAFPGVDVYGLMERAGQTPLPPYITGYAGDPDRYQTVYADTLGSAAAPTAGLHFTSMLMNRLREGEISWATVTLHIGLDTFRPITDEDVRQRQIHSEWAEVPGDVVHAIAEARERGGRVVSVGTSTVRALEFAARSGRLEPYRGAADLLIVPGYQFEVVDALLTNFHMPRTSVLLLAAAFAGHEPLLAAYAEAIKQRYRLLSFGDAMLVM